MARSCQSGRFADCDDGGIGSELEPLVAAREAEGITTSVVPVEEIYDAFGYGDPSPDAINAFVTYAVAQWESPAPAYLLLVGDATTDTRGYLAQRPDNPIEPPAISCRLRSLQSATVVKRYPMRVWLMWMAISCRIWRLVAGRWLMPTRCATSLAERWHMKMGFRPILFCLQWTAPAANFSSFTSRLLEEAIFPAGGATLLDGPTAQTVADNWNDGAWLISYVGHGSLDCGAKMKCFRPNRSALLPMMPLRLSCCNLPVYPDNSPIPKQNLCLRH